MKSIHNHRARGMTPGMHFKKKSLLTRPSTTTQQLNKTTRINLLKLILPEVWELFFPAIRQEDVFTEPEGKKKKSPTGISADTFLHLPQLSLFHSLECCISQHFTVSRFPYQQSDTSVHGIPLPTDRQVWHMPYLFWRSDKLWFLALGISKFGNNFITSSEFRL